MDNIEIELISDVDYVIWEISDWMDEYSPLDFKNEEVYQEKILNKLNEVLNEVLS